MADLPSDKVDEAKQVFEVFDKKYEVRINFCLSLENNFLY
jgi:hypothetical protein